MLLNDTHISVSWKPPTSPNGIVSYQVDIRETSLLSNDDIVILSVSNVTELELLVEYSIKPYSLYTTDVTSYTSAGSGETEMVTIQTPEEGEES